MDIPFEAELDLFIENVEPRLREILDKYQIPEEDREDMLAQVLLGTLYQWERLREDRHPEHRVRGTLRLHCKMYWRTKGQSA